MKIIRFTASWCQPCKQLSQILSTIETSMPIEVIDIDESPDLAGEFGIRSVPTMIMLDGITEVKRMSGMRSKQELTEWLHG